MDSRPMESEQKTPFLDRSSYEGPISSTSSQIDDEQDFTTTQRRREGTQLNIVTKILLVIYLPLLIAFAWLYIQYIHTLHLPTCTRPDLLPSPAQESGAISYEVRHLGVRIYNNPYAGPPRPELEAAWHDLLEDNNIVISKSEVDAANLETLELADESGYIVEPALAHQLHCLKKIRHYSYYDHYHANDSVPQQLENRAHIDHCIEMFRQVILCHGDQTFSSFSYLGEAKSLTVNDTSLHQCVDWPKLKGWMKEKSVRATQKGLLKPPQ